MAGVGLHFLFYRDKIRKKERMIPMKRFLAIFLIVCTMAAMLCGCGNDGLISAEKAQKIVLKDLNVSAKDVTMHTHPATYENEACYSIYVTVNGKTLEYLIKAADGEILAVNESEHSH